MSINIKEKMMKTLNFLLVTYLTVIPIASVTSATIKPTDELIEQAKVISDINDVKLSHKVVRNGFEEFKKTVYKEPFPGGVYIVNGDTHIANESDLREFYERELAASWKSVLFGFNINENTLLIVDAPQGNISKWDNVTKRNLTYCVSTSFGEKYDTVVAAMLDAAKAWSDASDVRFIHSSWLDPLCNENTTDVIFDVRPVDVNGQYLARAFFPRYERLQRNVLIDKSALNLSPGKLTLTGILRHELGHTLSFRHEQTRPEAGKCFEDKDWKPLTSYDGFSVMHYPQCNGLGDWSLNLTEKDKIGSACLYGPVPNAVFDPTVCSIKG